MLSVLKSYPHHKHFKIRHKNKKVRALSSVRTITIWSWKRDLNTRPAHYEWAALPTELFQHILNFSVSLFDPPPCRFINNPRPAHIRSEIQSPCSAVAVAILLISSLRKLPSSASGSGRLLSKWAALPTEPYQHIRLRYYTPKPHICQHQFKIFFKALQNPYQIVISYVTCQYNVWNKYVFFPHRYFAQ